MPSGRAKGPENNRRPILEAQYGLLSPVLTERSGTVGRCPWHNGGPSAGRPTDRPMAPAWHKTR
eukprot:750078-Pleurochrysis_carterae.AAC.2